MKILICSDGTPPADSAIRLGGLLAGASRAETTLLGITEKPANERSLRDALEAQAQAQSLRAAGVVPEIVVRAGEPIRQILKQTLTTTYDLVVIGSRPRRTTGFYWRSRRTYEVVKSIPLPVLVAIGECTRLKKFLVCTGGKEFIEDAVQLTGRLAAAAGASVTLLHVMAEPPAMYADLMRLEEDVNQLLESNSELGINLRGQKEELERFGVPTEVHVRHGLVLFQVLAETRTGDYDLIVTGSSKARGVIRHYIMGDLTRSILNHANCSVLVVRAGQPARTEGFWDFLKQLFRHRQS